MTKRKIRADATAQQRSGPHSQASDPTRRAFLQATGAMVSGWALCETWSAGNKPAYTESLALFGGAPSVTVPTAPAAAWPLYTATEEQAVLKLLRSPSYAPIKELEKSWQDRFDAPFCRAFCNGTSALAAMFFALDLPPGSEILVPSYTFFATIMPMRLFGLVPRFVDIDPATLNFDLEDAKRRLTPRTWAVLPVQWFGLPCDMDAIGEWASEKGLIVLEDAAHAHGARLKGRWMGNWGCMAIFSFQKTKPLPALEGGLGVYQHQEDFERATALGHYDQCAGAYAKYSVTALGLKLRMHPVAAVLAQCQLEGLLERNAAGVRQVRELNDQLVALPGLSEQRTRPDCDRIYYALNVLFLNEREAGMSGENCVKALRAEGVPGTAYSYRLQHEQPVYQESSFWHHLPEIPDLPGSRQANATAIALPCFTSEQPELVAQIVTAFKKVWAHRSQLGQ